MSSITIPELQNIKGIGNKTIDLIRQYIYKRDFNEYKPPKEIVKLERNGSYLGDCLDLMWGIEDESVDMILADLPYSVSGLSWDSIIPVDQLWLHYKRIIKKSGVIVLFGTEPFSTKLRYGNLEWFKYDWIWKKPKPTGYSHSKNMPLKDFEIISIFSPASIGHKHLIENRMTYNPQGVFKLERNIKRNKRGFDGKMERDSQTNEYVGEFSGFPKMVIEFNNVIVNKTEHPTEKPTELLEFLIKTYTNENDLVLDNVAGSFTTAIAALNTKRDYICIEKDPEYFRIGQERIKKWHEEN